jgi:Protein of unknown function (DUF3105)
VASRKEQKERLRRERQERERQAKEAERRRRLVGYGAGGALVLAAIVAVAVVIATGGGGGDTATAEVLPAGGKVPEPQVTDLGAAAKAAGCKLISFRAQSRDHIQNLNENVKYKTNPPTAGKHYVQPAADGAYAKAPADVELVHTQEHGRIIIWFKPTLPKAERAALKALFDQDSDKMVLVPRANMPYPVAATAWGATPDPLGTGYVMGCEQFTPKVFDALRTFRDAHRGKGPEPVP